MSNTMLLNDKNFYTEYNREYARKLRNTRKKRIQEIKQKMAFLLISILIIICLGIICGSFLSKAETGQQVHEYKYYQSYTVRYHDTVWDIAGEYMGTQYDSVQAYVSEVESINHIDADHIEAGDIIVIPYYSSEFLQ